MAVNQQQVSDPLGLLQPPSGYSQIYASSYDQIANDLGQGLCFTTHAIDFSGTQVAGFVNVLTPDQVLQLAPTADGFAQQYKPNGYSLYGTLIFMQQTTGLFGLAIYNYRYVMAWGGPC